MRPMRAAIKTGVLALITINSAAMAAPSNSPRLSTTQAAAVARQIAQLRYPEERSVAAGWTDAKKAAEFICRPLALRTLKRQLRSADRVFLGTDDPGTLCLSSDRQLTGSGQVRTHDGWQSFTFTCTMNPKTGGAAFFDAAFPSTAPAPAGSARISTSPQSKVPGCASYSR